MWFMPFAASPTMEQALNYETNGFEDQSRSWPPPDPDKFPRTSPSSPVPISIDYGTTEQRVQAFKQRQMQDYRRQGSHFGSGSVDASISDLYESDVEEGIDGEEGWTNSDGDRLRDYGVDEDAEIFADEDIPLGELLRRRKTRQFE